MSAKLRKVLECGCAETVSKLIFAPPKDPTRVIKTRHNSNGSEKFSRRTFFETSETVSPLPLWIFAFNLAETTDRTCSLPVGRDLPDGIKGWQHHGECPRRGEAGHRN